MPSVGAVTSNLNITSQGVAYTAKPNDFVLANATLGSFAVTLPTAPPLNTMVAVKKSDATTTTVTVVPPAGVSINGDTAGVALVSNGASVTVQYDGTNWQIVATGQPNIGNSVAGLPTGGASGQILVKSSTSNYDVGWGAAPAPGGGNLPMWASGTQRLYSAPYIPSGLSSTASWGYGYNYYQWFPLQIPNACTLTGIYVWTGTTASGATMGLGIYADAPAAVSGGPGMRLANASFSLAVGNNSFAGTTISCTFSAPQLVWIGYGSSASGALWSTQNNNTTTMLPGLPANFSGQNPLAPVNLRYTTAYTYTGAPDASGAATTATSSYNPLVFFTVA